MKILIGIRPPQDRADSWYYLGRGDTFGQAIENLIDDVEENTGERPKEIGDLIDTALEAWTQQLTGARTLFAQRREFSDHDNDFDLTITTAKEDDS